MTGKSQTPSFNLMTDPLIRVEDMAGALQTLTLPQVYAALMMDGIRQFPALRPHQAPAWHAFLVQVGAIAAKEAGLTEPPAHADHWKTILRGLTSEWSADEPWSLVAEADCPALLQVPNPNGDLSDYDKVIDQPDALDLLITSKNHDVKAARMAVAQPDDWLFSLISLQTQEGRLGPGNFGVARMNSGDGSRCFLGLSPLEGGLGAAIGRDISVLLADTRAFEIVAKERNENPLSLLWLSPWDGKTQFSLQELHPWFVEICRRIRLESLTDGSITARRATSIAERIDAKELQGNVGDPWAPIELPAGKVFTITKEGFSYQQLSKIIFNDEKTTYQKPVLLKRSPGENRPMRLWAAALARGKSKTEGFHSREIYWPAVDFDLAATRAQIQLRVAAHMSKKVLRPALLVLVQGGPSKVVLQKETNDKRVGAALSRFTQAVDIRFFPTLWDNLAAEPVTAERLWTLELWKLAVSTLDEAACSAPASAIHQFAHARARNLLDAASQDNFQLLKKEISDERNFHIG
jgi:CRISPR system Cascade subunit CasA